MFGWMIVFALMAILGIIFTLASSASVASLTVAMFGLLFVLGLVTRVVSGRAW